MKTKKAEEEKGMSLKNLMGYNDIVCKFHMCTFNVLDRAVSFSCMFI